MLVPRGATWRWTDLPPDGWTAPGFDDAAWESGRTPLGFGRGGLRTVLPAPAGRDDDDTSTYARLAFDVPDPARVARLRLRVVRLGAAAVFLNGREILRSNVLPWRELTPQLPVGAPSDPEALGPGQVTDLPPDGLRPGRNVLAVQAIRTEGEGDPALVFDLELVGVGPEAPLALRRGPYVQRVAPTGAVVRWRTNRPAAGRVRIGPAPERLERAVEAPDPGADQEVEIAGLVPGTRVFYAVEAEGRVLAGGPDCVFTTAPEPGRPAPTRIWVLGDSGTADAGARAVRDGFLAHAGGRWPDAWLMLGDNAYPTGSAAELRAAVFETYPRLLRRVPLWPVVGNHDVKSSDPRRGTGPFFEAFTLPTRGEAGGEPSGSEAWFSFDHGRVHFVALDSERSGRDPDDPMIRWLRRDLEAVGDRADWIVAYWHRAVLTRGTSPERGPRMRELRAHVVAPLERAGVDLVLSGHSHGYERSFLLGPSGGDPARVGTVVLDAGDGDPAGDGAYTKRGAAGAVFAVVGSSGQTGPAPLDHPAMARSLAELGSLVVDVDGCVLDGRFVDADGDVRDRFRMVKPGCPGGGGSP